jgi:hypothetical protein
MDDTALSHKDCAVMRDSDSHLRSFCERSRRLDKTSEQAQILGMGGEVGLRLQRRYLDTGDEWETLSAMLLNEDGVTLRSSHRILCQAGVRQAQTSTADDDQ